MGCAPKQNQYQLHKGSKVSPTENQQGIAADRVTNWMSQHIDDLAVPLSFELIAGGHSNLTYSVKDQKGVPLCCGVRRWAMY